MRKQLSDGAVTVLRMISLLLGVILVVAALVANAAGLSVSEGFSCNQIACVAVGAAFLIAGIAGRKFKGFYKGLALLLLNIIVALIILEIASLAAVKIIDGERFSIRHRKIEEGHLDEFERMSINGLYEPFVVWRANPAVGADTLTIDQEGWRVTPGTPEDCSRTVMLFGGSSMWGTSSNDRETIPAHLQTILNQRASAPVRVLNRGQTAWCTVQEVIQLMLYVRDGEIPDLVVFYDGFNDVWGSYQYGVAGTHHGIDVVEARLYGDPPVPMYREVGLRVLRATNTWLLVSCLREKWNPPEEEHYTQLETYMTMGIDPDTLARETVDVYLANMEVARCLADSYGFRCLFVVQPSLWYSEKVPSEFESDVLTGGNPFFLAGSDPAFRELFQKTYALLEAEAALRNDMVMYTDIFDQVEERVYTDHSGAHIYGWANAMVAERIYGDLERVAPGVLR